MFTVRTKKKITVISLTCFLVSHTGSVKGDLTGLRKRLLRTENVHMEPYLEVTRKGWIVL